jgi:hypothetical protein
VKLTKARLKEIIEEELGEVIRPRMDITPGIPPVRPGELRPPVAPAAPEEPAEDPSGESRDRLWSMVNTYIKFAKADPNVPDHIHYALNKIAQEIAKG